MEDEKCASPDATARQVHELKTVRTSHYTRICADNVSRLKSLYSKIRKKINYNIYLITYRVMKNEISKCLPP